MARRPGTAAHLSSLAASYYVAVAMRRTRRRLNPYECVAASWEQSESSSNRRGHSGCKCHGPKWRLGHGHTSGCFIVDDSGYHGCGVMLLRFSH